MRSVELPTFELALERISSNFRMATGDLKNNLMKLLREIRRMKIELEPDIQGLSVGSPSSFLSLLHASIMHYSLPLANWFTHHGYDLYGRSDLRFLQELYRVLRDVFHYHPKLTKEQFLSAGFAERKVLMTRDILLFCQAKHAELTAHTTSNTYTAKRKWKPSTSSKAGGNHGNTTTAPTKSWPAADVLTIQERAGIGSVWTESSNDYKVDEPSSPPPNMTPPPLLKCLPAGELDVTPPSIPPKQAPRRITSSPLQLSSSPPLQSSTPPLVHSSPEKPATSPVAITAHVIRHDSYQTPPPVTAVTEASSDKELNSLSSSGEEEGSWASLPQQREENEGRKLDDDGHQQEVPEAVGSRVEQLTKMVENLTAKFVLLENHLKLAANSNAQVQDKRQDPADDGETENAVGREKEREERKLPLRDITRETMLKQAQSTSCTPKQPLSMKQVNKATTTSEVALSQREPNSLSSVSTPEPSSKRMTLSSVREDYLHQRYTSHTSHQLDFATPSTPEETRRLIQSLRARAKETKDFLQLANSRLIDLS